MRTLNAILCALVSAFLAVPANALECANAGAAPTVAPDDTGDGSATACGSGATAGGGRSTSLGNEASSAGGYSTALGAFASSAGHLSTALGRDASSAGAQSIALGFGASSVGNYSAALGRYASSVGDYSTALGGSTVSAGASSTALGNGASSAGAASTALGVAASSTADGSVALGHGANSTGDYSAALGYASLSEGGRSTAVGHRAYSMQADSVILGSIPGVNSGTAYANVGIGTSNPLEAVDVERSAAAARFQLTSFTGDATQAPQFIQRRARGTRLAPAAVQNGDNLGLFSFRGYNGATMGGSRATITAQAAGNFTGASNPTRLIFSTTPVGQTTPQQVLVITPDGKVQVNGQNLTVPDYVFEDDYQLMPLEELKTFIDENGHLPGIASAQQVNEEGLDLAGSQMGLLQKVEELTLYTLQLQSQMKVQQAEIDQLKALLPRSLVANN